MKYPCVSRREWIYRFADAMVEATDYEMSLGEAVKVALAEHDRWQHASPEATVKRLMAVCESDLLMMAMAQGRAAQRAAANATLHAR